MKIAYIFNQYPQPSQAFIRREIAALEKLGVELRRFTVRRWSQRLVDPDDRAEEEKTCAVLKGGKLAVIALLFGAMALAAITRPAKFFLALHAALKLGQRAHRRTIHLVYLAEACVLRRWIAATEAEYLHAHFGTNSAAVAMLVHLLGGPAFGFTVHGPEEFDRPIELSLDQKARHASMVVAISEFGRSQLYRWCSPTDWHKLRVIRCGVDENYFQPVSPPPKNRLVCIGRLAEQKGQLILIEAAAVLARREVKFELVIVGEGPMREEIETRIVLHRLNEKIRLTGWLSNSEIRAELTASRAMVLPSFAEGLPVALMESLAMGRPVIATYVAGIPELVDSQCGWLVPAGNPEDLADAMQAALQASDEDLKRMGTIGAKRVRERHDAGKEAERMLTEIRSAALLRINGSRSVSNEEISLLTAGGSLHSE